MDKNKIKEKIKEGISVQEIEAFTRKHTTEVFSVIALLIGAISSTFDFFSGPGWTILFITLGTIAALFFPVQVERLLKQIYSFTCKQEKATEMILGGLKIVVAIFVPFIYFGLLGLLAGTSYHYYVRHAQIVNENKRPRSYKGDSSEEHD